MRATNTNINIHIQLGVWYDMTQHARHSDPGLKWDWWAFSSYPASVSVKPFHSVRHFSQISLILPVSVTKWMADISRRALQHWLIKYLARKLAKVPRACVHGKMGLIRKIVITCGISTVVAQCCYENNMNTERLYSRIHYSIITPTYIYMHVHENIATKLAVNV